MLVGSEREGGETYFALDVTSGKRFDDSMEPTKFLWEFADTELGQSWSEPAIERVAVKDSPADSAWGVFFGSGYLPDPAKQADKEAYLYGILAHDASDIWKDDAGNTTNKIQMSKPAVILQYHHLDSSFVIPDQVGDTVTGANSGATGTIVSVNVTGSDKGEIVLVNITGTFEKHEAIVSSGGGEADPEQIIYTAYETANDALASPLVVDMEGDYLSDRIYAGNLYGNMYRVTSIEKGRTPSVSTLFTFDHTSNDINPIRAKAGYAYAYEPDYIWLYFGTGRYEDQLDKINSDSQYFLGVKDWKEAVKPFETYRLADLAKHQAKFVTADIEIDGTIEQKTYRVVEGSNTTKEPWAIELFALQNDWGFSGPMPEGSERVLVKPLILGGVVFFVTFIPDEDICAGNGESWLFAVDYQTGLVPDYPVWDINGDGLFNDDDMIPVVDDAGDIILGPPSGIYIGRGQASNPVFHDKHLFITTTGSGDANNPDGGLIVPAINMDGLKVGLRSWQQL